MTDEIRFPCPRCGQDWLYDLLIVPTQQRVTGCPECDATWFPPAVPGRDPFVMLHMYLDEQQLPYAGAMERLS